MSKKRTRKTQYTNSKRHSLNPKTIKKVIRDLVDYDYLDKLNPEHLDYLAQFSREEYEADFRGKKLLTKSIKRRREIYKTNNKRNEDAMGITKNTNRLEEILDYRHVENERENKLLKLLDAKLTSEGFFNLNNRKNKTAKTSKKKS